MNSLIISKLCNVNEDLNFSFFIAPTRKEHLHLMFMLVALFFLSGKERFTVFSLVYPVHVV